MYRWLIVPFLLVPVSLYAKPKVISVLEQGLIGIAKSQLAKLEDQVGYMKDQLDVEKKLYEMEEQYLRDLDRNLSGSYDLGKLYNGAVDQAKRRWATSQGNDELNALKDKFKDKFNFKAGNFATNVEAATYEQAVSAQENAIVTAQFVSEKIEDNIDTIEGLMQKIDSTPNQKASTDLNSRIQAQVALELIELKRLQALQLESLGSLNQQYVSGKAQSAQFNQQLEDRHA